ncbi:MAG TPA: lipopolysaccharide assembly protein LapA domain-containing protein [Stellaceae bacterium]
MKLVHWLVTLPLAIILVIFAVSNREGVIVTLWPLPVTLEAPLYLVVLLALFAGFLVGELVAWINGRRWRREARRRARRIEALERELDATQAKLPKREATRVPVAVGARD